MANGQDSDPMVDLAITLTNQCQAYNCLPKAGGLFDQDPLHLTLMGYVLEAQHDKAVNDRKAEEAKMRH